MSREAGKRIEIGKFPRRSMTITEPQELNLLAQMESCDDQAARSRLQAVLLYLKGHAIKQILEEVRCSRSSLLKWYRVYRLQGPQELLIDRRHGGNNGRLTDEQIRKLTELLHSHTPRDLFGAKTARPDGQHWTVEDLSNSLLQWYGVSYKSRSSYYNLLRKCLPESQ